MSVHEFSMLFSGLSTPCLPAIQRLVRRIQREVFYLLPKGFAVQYAIKQ